MISVILWWNAAEHEWKEILRIGVLAFQLYPLFHQYSYLKTNFKLHQTRIVVEFALYIASCNLKINCIFSLILLV